MSTVFFKVLANALAAVTLSLVYLSHLLHNLAKIVLLDFILG